MSNYLSRKYLAPKLVKNQVIFHGCARVCDLANPWSSLQTMVEQFNNDKRIIWGQDYNSRVEYTLKVQFKELEARTKV